MNKQTILCIYELATINITFSSIPGQFSYCNNPIHWIQLTAMIQWYILLKFTEYNSLQWYKLFIEYNSLDTIPCNDTNCSPLNLVTAIWMDKWTILLPSCTNCNDTIHWTINITFYSILEQFATQSYTICMILLWIQSQVTHSSYTNVNLQASSAVRVLEN